jgi:hypothetical protein
MTSSYNTNAYRTGFKVRVTLAITFLLLGMALTLFVATPANAASATLTVNSKQLNLGDSIVISGAGFAPGEKIAFWLTDPAGTAHNSAYLNADNFGNFSMFQNKNYPVVSGVGTWYATVQGLTSGLTAVDSFQVLTPTLKAAGIVVGPNVVVPFSGVNWEFGERVQVWITDHVTGKVYGSNNVSYAWATTTGQIPASPGLLLFFPGTAGTYDLTVHGLTSNFTQVISFTAS